MKKALVGLMLSVFAVPMFAQTAPARLAVINVPKVLAESTAGKAAFEKLKTMQDEHAAKLKKMDDELKTLDAQINEKKMSLSADKLADLSKDFDAKKIAEQRYAQDAQRDLEQARDAALQEIEKQLRPVIDQIGKEMGFAAIFNKFESGIIYASDAIDITDTVIKRFDESTAAKGGAAAPKK
ncbi:MAG: OmpH family outer membrane protein [Thermoanaerobaculia bacterium]